MFNFVHNSRTKHIKVKHYFVGDHIANENSELKYVEFKSNIAAIFIKLLVVAEFNTLRRKFDLYIVE